MSAPRTPLHLILIGLPGAGKSTVGPLLADRLGTHCTDIDPNLMRATGRSIAELFTEEGEAAFRTREHRAVLEALDLPPHVVTPGGGWAAVPGNLDDLRGRAVTVHLDVAPRVAAQRLGGGADRPLLSGADSVPVETRLDQLLVLRGPFYRLASAALEVSDRSAAEVADLLVEVARTQAGWQ